MTRNPSTGLDCVSAGAVRKRETTRSADQSADRKDLAGDQTAEQVSMQSGAGWKWYGYAGHLVVGRRCAYHLCTRIGGFLISTVGHYLPDGRKMETIGAGADAFFETFVFKCDGDTLEGDANVVDWSEIDGERYATSIEAERGHYRYCHKYAGRDR